MHWAQDPSQPAPDPAIPQKAKQNWLHFRLIKKKRKGPTNKIKKGAIITHITEIQRIIRDYYEQLYTNKLENLEEMDNLLETHNLLKLNMKE